MGGNKKEKKFKEHKSHEWLKRTLLILVLVICVGIVACVGVLIGMYASAVKEIESLNVKNLALSYQSTIYYIDEDGNEQVMDEIYGDGKRVWLASDEIPKVMKDSIVAIEDERFYQHNGVDLKRTSGAFLGWAKAKVTGGSTDYGGSTITQQVIKNITKEKDKTVTRKVKEMLLAVALEKELTKDEILTIYLNLICLANNCYGVEAASNLYYNKSAIDLNLNEAAVIAGITQRPEYYNPLKNPDNIKEKRNVILGKMCELNMITEEKCEETKAKDLELDVNSKMKEAKIYSYFTDNLLNEVIEDLQSKAGYSKEMAEQLVYSGGLKIYSTADVRIQNILEKYYENTANFTSMVKKKDLQSAMYVMDQHTGEIKGMVGGIGKKTESRGLNRATQSKLQPGSAIKPISVYGPALEEDLINAKSLVLDAEIKIGNWKPENAYSGYYGRIPVRRAIQISSNTAAIRVLQKVTVDKSYDYMVNKFGITSLTSKDKNLSPLALGGLTQGVSPEEMTAAYSVFANGGKYIKPYCYTKVLDYSGNVLLENKSEGKQVIRESTAFLMTDLLTSVLSGRGATGTLAKFSDEMPISGKTGTTNDTKDKWFVGYTPYYTASVWCGFDQPQSLGTSKNISAKIWGDVMKEIHSGLEIKEFEQPSTVEKKNGEYFWEDSKLSSGSNVISGDKDTSSSDKKKDNKNNTSNNKAEKNDMVYESPGDDSMPENSSHSTSGSASGDDKDNDSTSDDKKTNNSSGTSSGGENSSGENSSGGGSSSSSSGSSSSNGSSSSSNGSSSSGGGSSSGSGGSSSSGGSSDITSLD